MLARKKVCTYVSFSSQNHSNFLGLKTWQIHCYYRISQEHSISTVTLRALIEHENVGYRWREMVTLGKVLSLVTLGGAIKGKIWHLWVSRLLENAFATIVDLKVFQKHFSYLLDWKPFKNDEKWFLFHLKSSFHSQDIWAFVMTFGHVGKTTWLER